MNKHFNFEDTIFILNVRLRMVRDLLRLDTDSSLFLEKTLDDLEFSSSILEALAGQLIANPRFLDRDLELDNLADIEWQFSQLLAEFQSSDNPFSTGNFPQIAERIQRLKETGAKRKKNLDEAFAGSVQTQSEPVVSSAELSGLLKGI